MSFTASPDINVLEHHGIKGQKWGVRRFQNADGSYTSAGKKRYGKSSASEDDRSSTIKRLNKKLLGEYDGNLNADIRKARNAYGYSKAERIDAYSRVVNKLLKRMDDSAWFDDDDRMEVYRGITENLVERLHDVMISSVWNYSGVLDDRD